MRLLSKNIILTFLVLLVTGVIAVLGYCWWLSGSIEKRFSGRKWKIPSTVYSDSTLLFPGKNINKHQFENKLVRLGYAKTEDRPGKKGEFEIVHSGFEIYLKDLNLPDNIREGFLVAIDIEGKVIKNIRLVDTDGPISFIELGPEVIMQFFGNDREMRRIVSVKNVPKYLVDAVISAEDGRFFKHFGLDPIGIVRALYTNIRYGSIRQGGSTLTQQLSKNYFLTPERTLKRKISELFISIAIELKYSKEEILEIYLNEIYLGQKGSVSINGVGEASEFYFGKSVENLTLSESAVIAGLIKGPNIYSPYDNIEKCLKRRNDVLAAMSRKRLISEENYENALNEPIKTIGYKAYNRLAPYFMDYVSVQLHEQYPETTLSSMGFSIYTTLDVDVQMASEEALKKGLESLESENPQWTKTGGRNKKIQGAVVVLQPRTGNILAMVGGRDYKESQFNRITQAKRQPGSCFKPIMVASLLDVFKPSDFLSNEEKSYPVNGEDWTPDNYEYIPMEKITVRDMLRLSCNRAAVDMAVRGGLTHVVDMAVAMHFSTPFKPYPSIALGAFDVIPLEMARAYCVFAADGVEPYPISLKDVADESGDLLVRQTMDIKTIISPSKAYLVTSMLESVVTGGTAKSLKGLGVNFPLAGKTGTSNNEKDAWFIGYTQDVLILVWVGFDNGDSIGTTGAGAAVPIFADIIKNIPGYVTQNDFPVPPGVVKKRICLESGKIALPDCPETYEESFLEEFKPEMTCDIHVTSTVFKKLFDDVKKIFK